jgi:hypothetical protein
LTSAAREIAQLRQSYQQQTDLISANTQALQSNTSAQGAHSGGSALGGIASGLLGGIGGIFSPVISGLASLFGGGPSAPQPLQVYHAPPAIDISGILSAGGTTGVPAGSPAGISGAFSSLGSQSPVTVPQSSTASGILGNQQSSVATNITIHVNAMDSQSFMDRSSDIASAVRQAMLNNHPINSVVADL